MRELLFAVRELLTSELFNIIVDVLSVFGFVITIFILIEIRKIKKHYVFLGRVPDLVKLLKRHQSNIVEYMNDIDGFLPQILEELTRTEVVLNSLKNKVDNPARESIKNLVKLINIYSPGDEDSLRSIYLGMVKIGDELTYLYQDVVWETTP